MHDFQQLKGKRVLITGGLGFIGATLAERLITLGAQVTLVDSLIPEYGGNLFNIDEFKDSVHVNISDVRDRHSMKYLIRGQDILFNLAGQTSHMDSMLNPYTDLDINASAQLSILEACRKYNPAIKIIFASTRQIYGAPQYLPVDEMHPLCPIDINGVNKLAGEHYHLIYNRVYGIRTSVLRLTNTIGPRMRVRDARQTFVGVWIRQLLEKKPFEVWGGHQLRDFTYVDDAVEAFLTVSIDDAADGRVFNLGGTEAIRLNNLGKLMIEVNEGGNFIIKKYPRSRKRIDIGDYYTDYRLISSMLGWTPRVSLREALIKTFDFYRKFLSHYL